MKKLLFSLLLFIFLVLKVDAGWYIGTPSTKSFTNGTNGSNCGSTYCTTTKNITILTTGDNQNDDGSIGEIKGQVTSANNVVSAGSTTVYSWDSKAPIMSANPAGTGRKNSDISITLSSSDTGGSLLAWGKYRWDNTVCSSGTAYTNSNIITLSTEGTHELYLCGNDNAGNIATQQIYTFNLDKTGPVVGYALSGGTTTTDTWTKNDVIATISCSDVTSGCDSTKDQYRESTSSFTCNSLGIWNNGSSKTYSPSAGTNLKQYICFRTQDNAGNYSYSSVAVIKIDKKLPIETDISGLGKTLNGTYFNADNSKDFSINVGVSGGSDIASIKGYFEKHNVVATALNVNTTGEFVSSLSGNLGITTRNVSIVDSDLQTNNYRIYSFKITEVTDAVGNTMIPAQLPTYNYYVYAGDINTGNSTISGANNFDDEIANGEIKELTLNLKDTYGNKVIPVKKSDGINTVRNLTLTANFTNALYRDQSVLNGESGVKVTEFDEGTTYSYAIATQETIISDTANNDGIYKLFFKVYSPTFNALATDGRQFARGNFSINSINGDTSDITGSVNITTGFPINFQFIPIYKTTITGELSETSSGFVEGAVQTGSLDITINGAIKADSINGLYLLKTGITNSYFTSSGIIDNDNNSIPSHLIGTGLGTYFIDSFINGGNYIIKTLLTLTNLSGYTNDIKNTQLYEYIKYTLGGVDVTHLSYIFNQSNNQNFETLKIYGITNIDKDKQRDLITNQGDEDIHNLAGEITKSGLKRDIRSAAINTVKFINTVDNTVPIKNLTGNLWNEGDNGGKVLGNILYYGDLAGENVELGTIATSNLSITGRKTIIVKGGNLYIKSNIINSSSSYILGIIVLKDENGKGGKVYIDTGIKKIDAIIYADKSVMSYSKSYDNGDGNNITRYEVDGNINSAAMQNQLYILGSVFSENTIGGSRLNPPVCPFYTASIPSFNCNNIEAQKYDFNYLRAGFQNKYSASYGDYPIIIKYNSAIQTTPPPLFTN